MRQQKLVVMGAFLGILLEACSTLSQQSPTSIEKGGTSTDIRVADCDGPAISLPPELRSMLEPRTGRMIPDDHWADIAERLPGGFAGILYDLDGKPLLMLTHPERAPEVKKALLSDYSFRHFDIMGAQVLQARWSFAQLVDWYNYLWDHASVGETKGFAGADKDEGTNRIWFAVETEAGRQQLAERIRALGVPCDLVRIGTMGKPHPL